MTSSIAPLSDDIYSTIVTMHKALDKWLLTYQSDQLQSPDFVETKGNFLTNTGHSRSIKDETRSALTNKRAGSVYAQSTAFAQVRIE